MNKLKVSKKSIVDKVEVKVKDDGSIQPIAYKGHVSKVIEINELEREFMNHIMDIKTLKTMFFAQFDLDYCGG
jgi:hypothetical protein